MKAMVVLLAALVAPAVVEAQDAGGMAGDAAAGEEHFNGQCVSCHVVVDEMGETLAGRRARVGPNLYAVGGRTPGTVEGFRYSDDMVAYGATGAVWDEASFVPYVQDPTGFLREVLDDPRARGKMAYQVRDEQEARDLWAYLVSLAPAAGETPPSETVAE